MCIARTVGSNADDAMNKAEFLGLATAAALDCSRTSGLPPGVTVAQAALESAFGASQLSRRAHNYFGIKAHGALPWIALPTLEYCGGRAIWVEARFARYDSMTAGFADRDRIILTLPCYAEARACAADPEAFVRALARHWATDPGYADKVLKVYSENQLCAYDQDFLRSNVAPSTGSS